MSRQQFVIRFGGLSLAEAGVEAQRLKELLADTSPDVDVALRRDRPEGMDMGATLVLLLGAPAIVAVAKGIAAFMASRGPRGGVLEFETVAADGSVKRIRFDGDSADASKVAEALRNA